MLILQQMAIFFFMLMLGAFARKGGIISVENRQVLTKIVVNITTPCMLLAVDISSVISEEFSVIAYGALVVTVLQLSQIASGFIAPWAMRFPKDQRGVINILFSCTNTLLLGIPLTAALYGNMALVYMSISLVISNTMVFSYGVIMIGGGRGSVSFRSLLTNPSFLASLGVIALIIFKIDLYPGIRGALNRVGNASPVLAMLVIGAELPDVKWKSVLTDLRLGLFVVVKMLVVPIIVLLLLKFMLTSRDLQGVGLVMLATPSGVMTAVLATLYNPKVVNFCAKCISLTTAVAVFTIPVVALVTGVGL